MAHNVQLEIVIAKFLAILNSVELRVFKPNCILGVMTDIVLTPADASESTQSDISKKPFFGKLANEIIQQIGDLLDIPALCALRKASSFLASCTEPCFRNCFRVKHRSTTAISTTKVKEFAQSEYASILQTLFIHLVESSLFENFNAVRNLEQYLQDSAFSSLKQVHIHVRGFSAPTTDRKVNDMARIFSGLVHALAAHPNLYKHVKLEIPNDPMIEPRSGALVCGKALSRFGGKVIQNTVNEFSMHLNTNTDLEDTMFDFDRSRPMWRGKLETLNVNYECNQWRWGPPTKSNTELGDILLKSPCGNRLTVLRLSHGVLSVDHSGAPKKFLIKCSSTLKDIYLKRITLPCRGWTNILKFFQKTCTASATASAPAWLRKLKSLTIEESFEQYQVKSLATSRVILFDDDSATGSATGNTIDGTMLASLDMLAVAIHRMDRSEWCAANNLNSKTLAPILANLKVTREVSKKRKAGKLGARKTQKGLDWVEWKIPFILESLSLRWISRNFWRILKLNC